MSTVLSTLQNGGLHGLLAAIGSLATWKTLALILAIINLKNLPFVWHVSHNAGFTCTYPLQLAFEDKSFCPECCATLLINLPAPPAVPFLGQPSLEAQCSFLSQGQGYCGFTGQTHTSSLRVMGDHVQNSVTGDGL